MVLLSSYLFGGSGDGCYDFLEKGDENLRKVQTAEYFTQRGFHSNLALTYYKRYEICMKYESENEKAPKSKESTKKQQYKRLIYE